MREPNMNLKRYLKGLGIALLLAFAAFGANSAYATEGEPAAEGSTTYYVWFDGSIGLKQLNKNLGPWYADAGDTCVQVTDGKVTLPKSADLSAKYGYTLNGWYDIYNKKYYGKQYLGSEVSVTRDTVFYADWVATSYDLGTSSRAKVTDQPDTSSFITNDVFDYNELFNLRSATLATGEASGTSLTAAAHTEFWKLVDTGGSADLGSSLQFAFLNWAYDDIAGHQTLASLNGFTDDEANKSKNEITQGIITDTTGNVSSNGQAVLGALFTKKSDAGRTYLGEGDGLYQYEDDTANEYYGYYYYDSFKNGASYNKSQQSFVLYKEPEYVLGQKKDGNSWTYNNKNTTALLPFNDNETGKYDEKDGSINYWFGLQSTIDFWLPNDPGTGGNIADTGKQMEFRFSGDDDVWVFVDDELVLDLGGMHGARGGSINFSTGEVKVEVSKGEYSPAQLPSSIKSGNHELKVCYLERGSSQSNCSIYFNIAPKYALTIAKKDAADKTTALEGARFGVYTDKACTVPAQLWGNVTETGSAENEFVTGSNGLASCYGLVAGNTYYVKELQAPEGYEITATDPIRITISNDGKVSADAGADFTVDAADRTYYLTVTNSKKTVPEDPEKPTEPENPTDPTSPETPETPENPSNPTEPESTKKPAKSTTTTTTVSKKTNGSIPATGDGSWTLVVPCLLGLAAICVMLAKKRACVK